MSYYRIVNKNRSEVRINSNLLKILKTLVRFSALVKGKCLLADVKTIS